MSPASAAAALLGLMGAQGGSVQPVPAVAAPSSSAPATQGVSVMPELGQVQPLQTIAEPRSRARPKTAARHTPVVGLAGSSQGGNRGEAAAAPLGLADVMVNGNNTRSPDDLDISLSVMKGTGSKGVTNITITISNITIAITIE